MLIGSGNSSMIRIVISLVLLATSAGSFEIYCESVENCWSTTYCCVMQHHAFIWTEGTTIANRDKSVTEVHFTSNRNIRFLPILLHESFPNLRFYAADKCIVEKVQKSNFELLVDLVEINLAENRISALLSDTFEGLRRLEIISLSRNYIKELNGQSFEALSALHHLDLIANDCINKKFIGRDEIRRSLLIISDKCGFDDSDFSKVLNSFKKSVSRLFLKPFTVKK